MKCVAIVLVTFLGLVAQAGNGFIRDGQVIDYGTVPLSEGLKGRLDLELAKACPGLVDSQDAGPVARVESIETAHEHGLMVYKVGLSFDQSSDGSPSDSGDHVLRVKLTQRTVAWKRTHGYNFVHVEVEGSCD